MRRRIFWFLRLVLLIAVPASIGYLLWTQWATISAAAAPFVSTWAKWILVAVVAAVAILTWRRSPRLRPYISGILGVALVGYGSWKIFTFFTGIHFWVWVVTVSVIWLWWRFFLRTRPYMVLGLGAIVVIALWMPLWFPKTRIAYERVKEDIDLRMAQRVHPQALNARGRLYELCLRMEERLGDLTGEELDQKWNQFIQENQVDVGSLGKAVDPKLENSDKLREYCDKRIQQRKDGIKSPQSALPSFTIPDVHLPPIPANWLLLVAIGLGAVVALRLLSQVKVSGWSMVVLAAILLAVVWYLSDGKSALQARAAPPAVSQPTEWTYSLSVSKTFIVPEEAAPTTKGTIRFVCAEDAPYYVVLPDFLKIQRGAGCTKFENRVQGGTLQLLGTYENQPITVRK